VPLRVAVDGVPLARPTTGIGTYTREMVRALATARPQHHLTMYLRGAQGLKPDAANVVCHEIPGPRLLGRHLRWPRSLRRRRYDAYFGPAGLMPLGSVGCPAVITVHDVAIFRHPEWFPPRQPLATRLVVPRSIARAAAIVADSQSTANDLVELFGVHEEKIVVVPMAVSSRYRPLPRADLEAERRLLGVPERFVLFVSTIEPRKNLETLLDAWAQLPARPPLVVAGGWGWRFEGVRDRIERLGPGVRVLGAVEPARLPALYNLATCLAHPAWYEGFGLTPLEAMACGTPVVCSDTTSLPEVVGDAALLAPPGSVEAWRRSLERVLADVDLRADLRRNGLLRAAQFTWKRTADLTWEVIEAVATRT
jgi:glycosyltransferase involved in cell wall biosynthesis